MEREGANVDNTGNVGGKFPTRFRSSDRQCYPVRSGGNVANNNYRELPPLESWCYARRFVYVFVYVTEIRGW